MSKRNSNVNKPTKKAADLGPEGVSLINEKRLFSLLPYFFSNPQKLIPELVQNAQRAGATKMSIKYDEKKSTLTVKDNGAGCKDWKSLIVLADSDWEREEIEDENPAGWGLYFLYSLASSVEITSLFGTVVMDCAFLKDVEHVKDHITVLRGKGRRGLELKAHLLPDVQLDSSAVKQDLAYFPLQVTLNGKKVKREKFCKGSSPLLKGKYQGNRYSISSRDPGFYTDDNDFQRQLSVCWYGYPIKPNHPYYDQACIDVRNGSPLTPVLPYRESVKLDEKLTRLREHLREHAIKTCLGGLGDRTLETRELRELSKLLAGIAPQEALDRAERFVVDTENPLDQEDYWDPGIESMVVEKKSPAVIEILPDIDFPGLDADDMVAVGLDCMLVMGKSSVPGWLKVQQRPYRIETVPVMEKKVDGWIDRRFVQAKILRDGKEIEAAFGNEDTIVFSTYSALYDLERHIFNRWFYYDDGDTYDTQWYEFERTFDRQIHDIRGFLPRAETISSLGEVLGKDLQGVTAIHIRKDKLELVGSKGTEVVELG